MSIKRTIITTLVALTVVALVAPAVTQATTVDDLLAQIAQLQAQLQGLQGGSSMSASSGTGLCAGVSFSRNLKVGSTGSDVKCLQQILSVSPMSGYFGPKTLAAVRAWQAQNGLTPANQVGPMSRQKLNASLGVTGGTPGNPVVTTGPVSATLAVDSPMSGALIGSEAQADLLHFNLTGSGTVTSVTLTRTGVSDQNLFTNVYLFDGATRLTDGYSFNNNGTLTMNVSIPVNGSHVISVRGDVEANAALTEGSASIAVTGLVANGTTATANVQGYMFPIISGSLAGASFSANTDYNSNTQVTVPAGTSQYSFWSAPLAITTRAVQLKGANFKMIGSAPSNALTNVKLFVDGVDTGATESMITISGTSYVSFMDSTPTVLNTGSHTIEVRGDVFTGASRTLQLTLSSASDIYILDAQVGVNVSVGTTNVPNTGANVLIATGTSTVVVDPTFNAMTNVTAGGTNQVIGRFIVHGYGENVKVNDLYVLPIITGNSLATSSCTDGTTCTLANVTLYFNGQQIGSTKTFGNGTTQSTLDYTLGSQLDIPSGQDSTLEVHADLQTSGGVNYTGGTIQVELVGTTGNSIGDTSQQSVSIPGTTGTNVTTNGLTISSANLQVSSNPAFLNQTVSPNNTKVKIGSYVLQNQSTSEAVRLTTLTVGLYDAYTDSTTNTPLDNSVTTPLLNDVAALYTSDTTGAGSTPIQPAASNVFSVSDVIQPGATMTIDIFGNLGATTSGTVITSLKVASIGVSSQTTSAGTQKKGQTMTLGTASISASTGVTLVTNPTQTTPAEWVAAGTGSSSQASFTFVASNAAATISELKFTVSDSTSSGYGSVAQVCVGTMCAPNVGGVIDLTGLTLVTPTGAGLTQPITVSYGPVGINGLTPGTRAQVKIAYVKYTTGSSTTVLCGSTGNLTCSGTYTSFTPIAAPGSSSYIYLASSVPSVSVASTTGASLNASNGVVQDAGRVTVTAGTQGAIKLRQLTFTIGFGGYSNSPTITQNATTSYLAVGSTTVAYCSASTLTLTCQFTDTGAYSGSTGYAYDYAIGAGQSATFDLYTSLGTAPTGTSTLTESATLARSTSATATNGMLWDDTSTAGASGTALNDYYLYGFPTNSTSIHN